MTAIPELQTSRLRLRQWRPEDRKPFALMSADPKVMEHFAKALSEEESDTVIERIEAAFEERGFGFWAVEIPNLDAGDQADWTVGVRRTADASTRRIADDRPSETRTVVRPQYGADDGRGLDFFHFFAAAAMRVLLARAGFRTDLRDRDFATAGRVGTAEFVAFLNRHCVLLSERQKIPRAVIVSGVQLDTAPGRNPTNRKLAKRNEPTDDNRGEQRCGNGASNGRTTRTS